MTNAQLLLQLKCYANRERNYLFNLFCCHLYPLGGGTTSDGIQNGPHWLTGAGLDLWGSQSEHSVHLSICAVIFGLCPLQGSLSPVSPWQCPGWLQLGAGRDRLCWAPKPFQLSLLSKAAISLIHFSITLGFIVVMTGTREQLLTFIDSVGRKMGTVASWKLSIGFIIRGNQWSCL